MPGEDGGDELMPSHPCPLLTLCHPSPRMAAYARTMRVAPMYADVPMASLAATASTRRLCTVTQVGNTTPSMGTSSQGHFRMGAHGFSPYRGMWA